MKKEISANLSKRRHNKIWTRSEQLKRVGWSFASLAFKYSPRLFWKWRTSLLKLFGATIGRGVRIYPSCKIVMPWNLDIGDGATIGEGVILYSLGRISIGEQTVISQYSHICAGTHDIEDPFFRLVKANVEIQSFCWICADAFIGPDVAVGEGSVVAARSVVVRDVDDWSVIGGNPAKFLKKRVFKQEYSCAEFTKEGTDEK